MNTYRELIEFIGLHGYCIECGSELSSVKKLKYHLKTGNYPRQDGCVIKPKIINNKKYYRKRCDVCFEAKFGRKPKKLNIVNYDMEYLFDANKSDIIQHRKGLAVTENNLILRYGQDEGIRRWNEYCEKQRITNTFEYKNQNYGWDEEKFKEFNLSRAVTKSNLISRHGEIEGLRKWNEYCQTQQRNGCTLDYFIEKYGDIEGQIKYKKINSMKSLTRDNFIRKYGEELGIIQFEKYINKPHKFYSKISQQLFDAIRDRIDNRKLYYATNNGEYGVYLHETASYIKLDFYDIQVNKCIEFFGDYWHCNPKQYSYDEIVNFPNGLSKVFNIWERDVSRINLLWKEHSIDTLCIWQHDYTNDPNKIITRCLEFLNDKS